MVSGRHAKAPTSGAAEEVARSGGLASRLDTGLPVASEKMSVSGGGFRI